MYKYIEYKHRSWLHPRTKEYIYIYNLCRVRSERGILWQRADSACLQFDGSNFASAYHLVMSVAIELRSLYCT